MTTLLIDADGFAFASAAAVQVGIAWDDDVYTTHADLNEAKDAFAQQIDAFEDVVEVADIILCFSCPSRRYFRHDLYPYYKGNRKGTPPPLVYKALKEWAMAEYESKTKPNLEADDVIGILATHPSLVPGEKIIVSQDKDLRQIPGLHLDIGSLSVHRISQEYADRFLWQQVLTGDTSDNYPGCPGIGPVKAEKILADRSPTEWPVGVLKTYEKAGLTKEDMVLQANVARILRATDYDFNRKEPILWSM